MNIQSMLCAQPQDIVLENWLDDVLKNVSPSANLLEENSGIEAKDKDCCNFRGLHNMRMCKKELGRLGLSIDEIRKIYRSLYVYSVGYFDVTSELLKHKKNTQNLIRRFCETFLIVCEKGFKVVGQITLKQSSLISCHTIYKYDEYLCVYVYVLSQVRFKSDFLEALYSADKASKENRRLLSDVQLLQHTSGELESKLKEEKKTTTDISSQARSFQERIWALEKELETEQRARYVERWLGRG